MIREKSQRKWQIPLSSRTHISRSTIHRWISKYRESGGKLKSLYPDDRNDRWKTRAINDETAQNPIQLRKEIPRTPIYALDERFVEGFAHF